MFDWEWYKTSKNTIATKLETVLLNVTAAAGVSYAQPKFYDFRYPNATNLLLIAEEGRGDTFDVELPSSFTFFKLNSATLGCGDWTLNGKSSWNVCGGQSEGTLATSKMPANQKHTIGTPDYGGLAVVYREQ